MGQQLETISTDVFECSAVSVFKIPPGNLSITEWNKYESSTIWSGCLRVLEEETYIEEDETEEIHLSGAPPRIRSPSFPVDRIRLKLELYNEVDAKSELWAVVWYNPIHELDGQLVQLESIQRTEAYRLFKIIVQIPGSKYTGSNPHEDLVQVALGLKFDDKLDAYTFIERLNSYQKSFHSYVEQYKYELEMGQLAEDSKHLSLDASDETNELSDDDNDQEDDFGDFVG
ncbi:hypothetical protein PSN45_002608 [Yamadazyma tenuis]|uniref:Uncharacterized protein n=1 Tax=Candida tenuis (strain ATCC 10573 / BCRC 21748 / CBS 615 / JCM 9827 / NBRC 10315 / NRRL Y-1498 / VKM Y-70) TaxID=590646 RepID=G3AZV3_CANTC|nr:uncharacterized protein CANTEDRAFT_112987 [Yamadazyma tenuis ATCC 10573]XP_006685160.1 uncharacterized protein CANTEDRAFT_112987 [Yamadazyma tenuis ATCC 10573]EGV65473.1 hypothetical protein CANTEDRAFT_112987 [Yamadazyma tenuis ATCC 10573]EGV65474.1 hypothetical protein CANTEDRAFT_112987 [Yamadazyma tenuis ATCC 10573]WEJ95098.1 hypothetical protein PSN45_002608 [Yamadazyma tenuis]